MGANKATMGTTALLLAAMSSGALLQIAGGTHVGAAVEINESPKPYSGPFTSDIEAYTAYDGQTKCIRKAKPGVVAFERYVLRRFARTSFGIARSCSGDVVSEHKEGRAIDWHMSASNPVHREKVRRLFRYLFKTDWWGNPHAKARRLGIMYIIWNKRMWRSYRPLDGWQKYEGSNPHTDHVHISFARAGANGMTSFWTGKIADLPEAWIPRPSPTPSPSPSSTPTSTVWPEPTGP